MEYTRNALGEGFAHLPQSRRVLYKMELKGRGNGRHMKSNCLFKIRGKGGPTTKKGPRHHLAPGRERGREGEREREGATSSSFVLLSRFASALRGHTPNSASLSPPPP